MSENCRCPVCNHEVPVPTHAARASWLPEQIAFARRCAAAGVPLKVVGRVFGVAATAVQSVLRAAEGK